MFVFMVLHYPAPGQAARLAQGMAEMRAALESRPGCLGVEPPLVTEDGSCLVGYSRWESREAFLATGITLRPEGEIPAGEVAPRRRFLLTAAGPGPAADA
jgi:hypothetical protein